MLNKEFIKNNLIEFVFGIRHSYGTDVHMGCTLETNEKLEKMIVSFMELAKKEDISENELSEFNNNKEELFGIIFNHKGSEDNYEVDKIELEMKLEKIKFDREFIVEKNFEKHPLIENVVESFDE